MIKIDDEIVSIRDQAPLQEGHIRFEGGWQMADLLKTLNDLVFFWPGTAAGPNDYGKRHFERYKAEGPAILRVRFESLVIANPASAPLFCKYNSGSPRCSNGQRSPRGPSTFVRESDRDFPPSRVVEVVFRGLVELPEDVEVGEDPSGPWQPMFD